MAVPVLQVLEQVVEAQVRLVDADRLVEPDPARHRQAQRQRAERDPEQDPERDVAGRVRLAAPGHAALRAEQLGLAGAAEPPPERSPVRIRGLTESHAARLYLG